VVPWSAGGGTDILARAMAAAMGEIGGTPVVVDNRAGANGIIGTQEAARARPDGTTILMATADTHAINPAVRTTLPYDAVADFSPLMLLTTQPLILCVHPSVPARSLAEFIELVRRQPGAVSYASWGAGSTAHMAMELLAARSGMRLNHVPYRGAAPAQVDLMSGVVQAMFTGPLTVNQMHPRGQIRCLATTAAARAAEVPDVPTFGEAGMAELSGGAWYGLMAPARTPEPILAEQRRLVADALARPAVRERAAQLGHDIVAIEGPRFAAFVAGDIARWRAVAQASGITVE
jgi:tripartite-type tricarboxylate transporter receptor subunit TctC